MFNDNDNYIDKDIDNVSYGVYEDSLLLNPFNATFHDDVDTFNDMNGDYYGSKENDIDANQILPSGEKKAEIKTNSKEKTNWTDQEKNSEKNSEKSSEKIFSITKEKKNIEIEEAKQKEEEKEEEENQNDFEILGKKRNLSNGGKHDKFCYDNMTRKLKTKFFETLLSYTNSSIEPIPVENEKKRNKTKKIFFLKINQKIIKDINVISNQKLLNDKLKDIFSEDVSSKMANYGPDYNRKVINQLIEDQSNQAKVLASLERTFLECLEHFRGTKYYEELAGLEKEYDKVINGLRNSGETEEYITLFKDFVGRFEIYYQTKKARPGRMNSKQ